MFVWFTSLDPTAQVAMLGLFAALSTGTFGLVRTWLRPKNDEYKQAYTPKTNLVQFAERDINVLDDINTNIAKLSETIERLRVEISFKK